jgi:hypothetical protein
MHLVCELLRRASVCVCVCLCVCVGGFLLWHARFVFPDQNGERVSRLACQQLSYAAVKLANKTDVAAATAKAKAPKPGSTASPKKADGKGSGGGSGGGGGGSKDDSGASAVAAAVAAAAAGAAVSSATDTSSDNSSAATVGSSGWSATMLRATFELVTDVSKSLDACRQEQVTLPHELDLTLQKRTQTIDGIMWEVGLLTASCGRWGGGWGGREVQRVLGSCDMLPCNGFSSSCIYSLHHHRLHHPAVLRAANTRA